MQETVGHHPAQFGDLRRLAELEFVSHIFAFKEQHEGGLLQIPSTPSLAIIECSYLHDGCYKGRARSLSLFLYRTVDQTCCPEEGLLE